MARTSLTAIAPSEAGIDLDSVDAAVNITDGNSFVWTPRRKVYVNNGDDASLTVTFVNPSTVGPSALAVADKAVAMAAGSRYEFGPFDQSYRQADGSVWIDFSGTTPVSVTAAVLD